METNKEGNLLKTLAPWKVLMLVGLDKIKWIQIANKNQYLVITQPHKEISLCLNLDPEDDMAFFLDPTEFKAIYEIALKSNKVSKIAQTIFDFYEIDSNGVLNCKSESYFVKKIGLDKIKNIIKINDNTFKVLMSSPMWIINVFGWNPHGDVCFDLDSQNFMEIYKLSFQKDVKVSKIAKLALGLYNSPEKIIDFRVLTIIKYLGIECIDTILCNFGKYGYTYTVILKNIPQELYDLMCIKCIDNKLRCFVDRQEFKLIRDLTKETDIPIEYG